MNSYIAVKKMGYILCPCLQSDFDNLWDLRICQNVLLLTYGNWSRFFFWEKKKTKTKPKNKPRKPASCHTAQLSGWFVTYFHWTNKMFYVRLPYTRFFSARGSMNQSVSKQTVSFALTAVNSSFYWQSLLNTVLFLSFKGWLLILCFIDWASE